MPKPNIARVAIRVAATAPNMHIDHSIDGCRLSALLLGLTLDEESSRLNADIGVSGVTPWADRPGLTAHFGAAQRGEFSHLFVSEIKHLGRDTAEVVRIVEAFMALGVSVCCRSARLDPSGLRLAVTPAHALWEEFISKLEGEEGCNFKQKIDGDENSWTWRCGGGEDKTYTREILAGMGCSNEEIEASCCYFEMRGGHCDCEIVFNIAYKGRDGAAGYDRGVPGFCSRGASSPYRDAPLSFA